jgi:hypothetical protein
MSLLTEINRRMDPTHNEAAEIQAATRSSRNTSGNTEQQKYERQKYEWQHGTAEITERHHGVAETERA